MKLITIGSNSSGNGYILSNENESLILELGCDWMEYEKAMNYDLSSVLSCVTSHIHQDHSNPRTISKALQRGIDVYSCQEVADKYDKVKPIVHGKCYTIGSFKIRPFNLFHNVMNIGFIVECNGVRICFATDTNAIPYKFKNINHFLIEANHSIDNIVDNAMNNQWNQSQSDNHFSIERCCDFLKVNYSPSINSVILCHLSNNNSDSAAFIRKVKESIGIEPKVAKKGLILTLNNEEF